MKHDLSSGTDVAQHALYDPTCVREPERGTIDELLAQAVSGALLVVTTGADGELGYVLYVDEPLADEHRPRVEKHTPDVLLRVPSGQLRASGLEEVGPRGDYITPIEVPPGNYLVDVYELDYDWDEDIEPVLERELGPAYRHERRIGPLGGFGIVAGLFMAMGGLFTWTLWLAAMGVAGIAVGVAILWLGAPRGDYHERKRAIDARFPPLALVMRRLADDASVDGYRGAVLELV